MRMFEIGRQGGFVLRLAIRDSTESSSLSLVCPRVRSVSNFILVSCILTSSFFDPRCPECFRCPVCPRPLHWSLPRLRPCLLCCVNSLRCGLLLIPFRQFGIRRHSLAKGLTKGHTTHYKRPQGCKLLIYRLLMLMTTGSARRLNTHGRNSITVGCT